MFKNPFSSPHGRHLPKHELELANLYLEHARKQKDPVLILAFCNDTEAALSRIKRPTKKVLANPLNATDQTLHDGIASAYLEHGKLMKSLGWSDKAETSFRRAEKWGHPQAARDPGPTISSATDSINQDVARVPENIFPDDMRQPTTTYTLPDVDQRLDSTSQLAYCLGLLQATLSSDEAFEPTAGNWVMVTEKNPEEKERLKTLAVDLIRAFTRDELKDSKAVAEVVCLGPVLDRDDFRYLLMLFINGIDQSSLLDVHSLEGLAQLLQSSSPGFLNADDLVKILGILNARLQETHSQSLPHIHQLTLAVSTVLDVMADSKVSGLKRVELHEPLSAYLNGLKASNDPYLVYQAAYALQALQCVPDNESPWQATMRRTGIVLKGVSGMVSAVKGLDVNGFITGLGHLQEGLGEVTQVAKIGYEGVSALVEGGQGLVESLKVGLTFDQKRAWYTALRGADTLLRDGQLAKFKILVCEAPCRRDLAFQMGVCQRLGELAANPLWDDQSREGAVAFLGELYRNDTAWGQQALVKQWILYTLMDLASAFNSAFPGVGRLLKELESDGEVTKRTLYGNCQREDRDRSLHPLKMVLPAPKSPSLLDRVQNKQDVEMDLRRLRKQRLQERGNAVYIAPRAKANLQASDDELFDLTEYVGGFLSSDHYKVMLLLGDSGTGKSTFIRALECDLWGRYSRKEGRIPLYINLPEIDKPEQDLIAKHLRKNDFTEPQIREMKYHREFILICDGYDESQQIHNLYTTNLLNQPGQWRAQMVISCRSEYLPQDYRDRFQPVDKNHSSLLSPFQEAVVAPFSPAQIQDYVERFVFASKPVWQTMDYMEALGKVPDLLDLVKNPFLLTLSLEVLPRMMDPGQDLTTTRITRVALYDQFVEQWLERGKKRLGNSSDLTPEARKAFERLADEGFARNGIIFLKDLAAAIYKYQAGNPVVEYLHKQDHDLWKKAFFNRDEENQLLLEACPLIRNGSQYRFVHQSLLEYCFARAVFEPKSDKLLGLTLAQERRRSTTSVLSFEDQAVPEDSASIEQPVADHPLARRSFVSEPSILQFLAERVQQEPLFEKQLLAILERSKVDKEARKAAANAITILVRAGVRFNGADLKGVRIPGADLSGGEFDSAQLQGADMRKVNLRNIWLYQANLDRAQMVGVRFGERPFLQEVGRAKCCAYSPDGKVIAVGLRDGNITTYEASTCTKTRSVSGHTRIVRCIVYSPSGMQMASCGGDKTVRLWNAQTGSLDLVLSGHKSSVNCVVFSPDGQQIASAGFDKTVRLWDVQNGAPGHILSGHTNLVMSVAYSPSGGQIVSASTDKTLRLWDVQSGAPGSILSGHADGVNSVVFSPNGHQIASCSADRTVRLWDAQTGALGHILRGHTSYVGSVVFSPSGQQIASASYDKSVRLWDTQTSTPGPIFDGHHDTVGWVVYSPSGRQLASCSADGTVRLWDVRTNANIPTSSGHTQPVWRVIVSPCGQQLASGSADRTMRLWDAETGAPGPILRGHSHVVKSMEFSPSGRQIASGSVDKTVRLWDVQTGATSHILSGHTESITSVAYSPSCQRIASASEDKTVRLWDAQTGAAGLILSGHTNSVRSVAFSPSGEQIISSSVDKTVRLWDLETGALRFIFTGHAGPVNSVAYSPIGHQIVSSSQDETVRLWDAQTGAPGDILSSDTVPPIVIYSPSGQQIALIGGDNTVRLQDAFTGTAGPVLSGHTRMILSAVYSPSGHQIASGSSDRTARLWDVSSGQCLAVVEGFQAKVTSIAWNATAKGTFFATGCHDHSVRMWQVVEEEGRCRIRLYWGTALSRLNVLNASIRDVNGLSKINMRLLGQRGAVGDPIPPLGFREAAKKVINMASVATKLKPPSNQSVLDTIADNIPMANPPTAQ